MGYWQIAAAVFALDTAVKYKMDQELPENGEGVPALGNAILLRKTYNKGAMLGLGKTSPKAVAGVTAALTAALGLELASGSPRTGVGGALYRLGFALLLGGGANNVCDRLLNGHVTDYFSFRVKWKWLNKIIFNLSDLFIFLGALLVIAGSVTKE